MSVTTIWTAARPRLRPHQLHSTVIRKNKDCEATTITATPVTFAAVYVGTTFKGLSEITHGWNEVSTSQWVFLILVFGISVILLAFVTRIARASLENEEANYAQINSSLTLEMLFLIEDKGLYLPKPVKVRIDPLREHLERKMIVTL